MHLFRKLLVTSALAAGVVSFAPAPADAQVPAPPLTVNLSADQTGIRNQADRNLCTGFAMIAAIEARYRRDWGRTLNLSEQYYWHTYKSTGVEQPHPFRYENQSSFWGGGSILGLEAARTYAIPTETDVPYLNQTQMNTVRDAIPAAGPLNWNGDPALNTVTQAQVDAFEYSTRYIPLAARFNARYGVSAFTNHPAGTANNPDALERILAGRREVLVGLHLNWRWNADRTIRVYDASVNEGAHAFLLIGYDHNARTFLVKNSWGESGPIRVHYDVLQNSAYEAASVDSVTDPNTISSAKGRFLGQWNVDYDGWRGAATIRRSVDRNNATTRLGHFVPVGSTTPLAINGYTGNGGSGLAFSIESTTEPPLTQMNGTRHTVFHSSKVSTFASGQNVWSGIGFGTLMSRNAITATAGTFNVNSWIGSWRLFDDGVAAGTLRITGVGAPVNGSRTVTGQFTTTLGTVRTITATVSPDHRLHLTVNHPTGARIFELLFHTRETNLLSGYTSLPATFTLLEAHATRI